jgi:hypothetical protein
MYQHVKQGKTGWMEGEYTRKKAMSQNVKMQHFPRSDDGQQKQMQSPTQ